MVRRFSEAARVAVLGSVLAACGGGGGGEADGGDPAIERGRMIATSSACASCHGADYSGGTVVMAGVYPQNITPDETHGIGAWTDAEIIAAVRMGVDPDGGTLCPTMPRFASLTDAQAMDLVAFLRSVAPSENDAMTGVCAGPSPAP